MSVGWAYKRWFRSSERYCRRSRSVEMDIEPQLGSKQIGASPNVQADHARPEINSIFATGFVAS